MDPVTTAILAALGAGAIEGITSSTKDLIAAGYEKLKAAITHKHGENSEVVHSLQSLEAQPGSQGRQLTLNEELTKVRADADLELRSLAQSLLDAIRAQPGGASHIQNASGTGISQASDHSSATVNIFGGPGKNGG